MSCGPRVLGEREDTFVAIKCDHLRAFLFNPLSSIPSYARCSDYGSLGANFAGVLELSK